MEENRIIAAIRSEEGFNLACSSKVKIVFDLAPSIETFEKRAEILKKCGKKLFIHIDMAEGIGKDKAGLNFIKQSSVCGIISTRTNLIKLAHEVGLSTVHRMFIVDSQSALTAINMLKVKPDMAEIMPGTLPEKVIKNICEKVDVPVIAGGLVETEEEVANAISAGAVAVSTGKISLWGK